jgi:fibronectin-binding autotransporter adhesin
MTGIKTGTFPRGGGCGGIFLAALAFLATQANPARVYAQTNGTWTSGTGVWSNSAKWSGTFIAGGTNATATFTTSGGTATLTSNIVLGNITTLAVGTSPRTRINATTAEQLQFATTTGTAPTVTAAGRAEIAAIITGTQGYTKAGTGDLYIWAPNTYTGTTTISAGRLRLQASTSGSALGSPADGTVVLPAGTLMLDGAVTVDAEPLMISGTGNGNQGSLRQQTGNGTFAGPITATGNASITANTGATLTLSGLIDPNSYQLDLGDNGNYIVSGGFVGTSGTVRFTGPGAITLSGSSSFTGTTSVVNSTGLVTMTGYMAGLMDFAPGGARTLAGTGTFAGGLYVGNNATLAPGATAATSDYATITASTLEVQSATVQMGIQNDTTYDRLVMTAGSNGLTLGGSASLNLDFANELTNFTTLDLFDFTGLSGSFLGGVTSTGSYAGPWTESGGVFTLANVGPGGAQTLTFNQATGDVVVVPEPSTTVLLGSSIAAVASLIRLRRRASSQELAAPPSLSI